MSTLDTLISREHLHFEQSLLSDPDNESLWLDYVEQLDGDIEKCRFVLDRAVSRLPASNLLWNAYFLLPWTPQDLGKHVNIYRKALVMLGSSPSIWMRYLRLLMDSDQKNLKSDFDHALFLLDIQYHGPIWKLYLTYADKVGGHTGAQIYCRYMTVCGRFSDGPDYCVDELVLRIAKYDYKLGRKVFAKLWTSKPLSQLLSLVVDHYCDILDQESFVDDEYFESIVRDAVATFPDMATDFYRKLAVYYEKRNRYDAATHAFTRGIKSAISVKQVTTMFDALAEYLEKRLDQSEHRMDILEKLLDDRPLYVNDIKISQNVNLVDHWLERVDILSHMDRKSEMLSCYVKAITCINPLKSVSKNGRTLADLWIQYANVYMSQNDLSTANLIFSRAIKSQFKTIDELADIHIAWAELMLEKSDEDALNHISQLLKQSDSELQQKLAASPKLWEFRLDLLKVISDSGDPALHNPQIVLGGMIGTKAVTLGILLDYASYLQSEKLWEAFFAALNMGLTAFVLPEAKYEIWKVYLPEYLRTATMEETRNIYDKCLAQIPPFHAKEYYLEYSEFEKHNKLILPALRILKLAIQRLTDSYNDKTVSYTRKQLNTIADDKYEIYIKILDLVGQYLKDDEMCREEYTRAVEDAHLTTPNAVDLTLRFIRFENENREFTRVRALFNYVCGLANPNIHMMKPVWNDWEEFELEHGSEKTYKTMLGRKREIAKEFEAYEDIKSSVNPMGFTKSLDKEVPANPDAIDLDMDM